MKDKYCLPIIQVAEDSVLAMIEQNKKNYGFFEIWLDYIEDLSESFVSDLIHKFPGQLVFVFRRQNLESIKMPDVQRFKVLDALSGEDCLVDLDITVQADDLKYAKSKDLKKIVSFHNYQKTPDTAELEAKIAEMEEYNPYIVKLSTFCNETVDALRLLELQQELIETGQKHIVLGMGANGQITRIFATLWGNELAFVPEDDEAKSADGQISRTKFERILQEITNAR